MSKIKYFFTPLIILLVSFYLRLSFICKGPFHYDALKLAINAQKTLATFKLHYLDPPGSPLTVIIATVTMAIFKLFSINDPVLAVNFMAVFISSLCVSMMYLVVKELLDEPTAVFSALFLMVFPLFLSVSLYGKNHAISLLFVLMSVYLMLKYLSNKQTLFLVLSGLSLGLCGSVRPTYTLTIIPILLLFTLDSISKKNILGNLKRHIFRGCGLFILMFSLPLIIFYVPYIIHTGLPYIMTFMTTPGSANKFMGLFSPILPSAVKYALAGLSPWGAVISIYGLYILFPKNKKVFFFLLSWFLILFLYHGNLDSLSPRFLIIGLVPMIISAGYAFSELTRINRWVKPFIILFFIATIFWLFNNLLPTIAFRHQYALQEDFARWVAQKTEKNAVVMAMDEGIFIEYYGKRKTLNSPVTCDGRITKQFFADFVDRFLKEGVPLYLTSSGLAYDHCGTMARLLEDDYRIEPIGCRINEDWHHSCIKLLLFKDCLFRIRHK